MNLLFIAYHFPPIGGAGAQRSAKFVRYLAEFGVQPIVIGGPTGSQSRWEPADVTQLDEIPEGIPVYRPTVRPPPDRSQTRLRRFLVTSNAHDQWWQRQIAELGGRAAAEHPLDAIFVSLLPYQGLAAAVDLGKRLDLPVIADLRDPWALDEVRLYPTRLHRYSEQQTMRRLLSECALVVANTPEATSAIANAFPELSQERLCTITNGYDLTDFQDVHTRPPDGRLRIVHTGYLHSSIARAQHQHPNMKRVLGGSLWQIDLLCRSHYYLLEAVSLLMESDPDFASNIDIVLAGVMSDEDQLIINESPARDHVQTLGYIDHGAAIREMMAADILFLPMHGIPSGRRARIVPGKTYEYLATGRPLLAAVPDGDAKDFIAAANAGITTDPCDAPMIARAIQTLAQERPEARNVGKHVEQFERRDLTRRLARHLGRLQIDRPGTSHLRDAAP